MQTTTSRIDAPHISISMIDFYWPTADSGTILHSHHMIEMTLSRHRPRSRFRGSDNQHQPMGNLIFIPAGKDVALEWEAGKKTSICCFVDPALTPELSFGRTDRWDAWLNVTSGFSRAAMNRLARELRSPSSASPHLAESICKAVLFDICNEEPRLDASPDKRLDLAAVDGLLDAEGPLPALDTFADAYSISVRHFTRMFRECTGMTLSAYAQNRRIERAKALLLGPMRIKEIAWRSGFREPAAFTAVFRRHTGLSPSEYRHVKGAAPDL